MREIVARALAPLQGKLRGERIAALTGLTAQGWRELARHYPELPENPGAAAARRRARLARLASRALSTGRWSLRLAGEAPPAGPCLYATAHLGSLQTLRYALRARGVAAATVLGPYNLDRARAIDQDRVFDRRHPLDFPHALPASAAHRLRRALAQGSLVAAADLPEQGGVPARVLGGPALLDVRPFRLAKVAGVPSRAAFATIASGRWTLTISPPLPRGEEAACQAFARAFDAAAREAPLDLDGLVYTHIAGRER